MSIKNRLLAAFLLLLCCAHCSYNNWTKVGDSITNYSLGPSIKIDPDLKLGLDAWRTQWPTCEVFQFSGEKKYQLGVYFELATRILPGQTVAPFKPFAVRVAPFGVELFLVGDPYTTIPPLIRYARLPCKEVRRRFDLTTPII